VGCGRQLGGSRCGCGCRPVAGCRVATVAWVDAGFPSSASPNASGVVHASFRVSGWLLSPPFLPLFEADGMGPSGQCL
jgi:hypothetical protein